MFRSSPARTRCPHSRFTACRRDCKLTLPLSRSTRRRRWTWLAGSHSACLPPAYRARSGWRATRVTTSKPACMCSSSPIRARANLPSSAPMTAVIEDYEQAHNEKLKPQIRKRRQERETLQRQINRLNRQLEQKYDSMTELELQHAQDNLADPAGNSAPANLHGRLHERDDGQAAQGQRRAHGADLRRGRRVRRDHRAPFQETQSGCLAQGHLRRHHPRRPAEPRTGLRSPSGCVHDPDGTAQRAERDHARTACSTGAAFWPASYM